ncbi:MAG TPA: energy transducer TonB [Cytophagales bacterium]|nr:energy transducer TonB [Cytophagales bacterium]
MKKHKVIFKNVEISDVEMEAFMDFSEVSNKAKKAKSALRRSIGLGFILFILLGITIYLGTTNSNFQKKNTEQEMSRPSSFPLPMTPDSLTQQKVVKKGKDIDSISTKKYSHQHKTGDKIKGENKSNRSVKTPKANPPAAFKPIVKNTETKDSSNLNTNNDRTSTIDLSLKAPLTNLPVVTEDSISDKDGFPIIKTDDIYIKAAPKEGFDRLFRYFYRNLKYPEIARKTAVEGTVVVEFVVSEKGKISNIRVKKGLSKELNVEAKRLVKEMPPWNPALLNNKPVKSKFTIPIKFSLEETSE